MSCDIVIAVWNKNELTRRCIESIIKNTRYPYRLIIVDNASALPTQRYLESLKEDRRFELILIRNEKNLGNTVAVNQGLKASSADFVCNLDNDTMVTKGWLEEMVAIATLDKNIGLVVPSSNTTRLSKRSSAKDIEAYARKCLEYKGKYVELGSVGGFCILIRREVIEKIGVWNEIFSPGYFDDTEYAVRAANVGYKLVHAKGAYVYHREHSSFKDKNLEKIFKRNREIFHEMYGKPKRILYVISKKDNKYLGSLKERTYRDANNRNWVNVFIKDSVGDINLIDHGSIKKNRLGTSFFNCTVLIRSIVKKKKFDLIYADSKRLSRLLLFFKKLHKADVKWL